MIISIEDFLSSNNKFSFPLVPTGKSNTVEDFYKDCISLVLPKNVKTIIEWHNLLRKYIYDPEAILLSRLYESRKINGIWDTRRGMLTRMQDGFSFAFASNFFARIIYTMAFYDFVPEYEDFKDMFKNRKFSLFSFMGKTEGEKNYAAFINPSYNPRFYTQNWYLAHIIPVNGESFYRFENKNINDIFTPGSINDWKVNSSGYYERFLDYSLSEDDKKIARAHFLRFIDPINYFLVPNANHVTISKIGEMPSIINYMRKRASNLYLDVYDDFLKLAMSNPQLNARESCDLLGKHKLMNLEYSSENLSDNCEKSIPPKNKLKKKGIIVKINPTQNAPLEITSNPLINELKKYKTGTIDKGFSEIEFSYNNDFISTICFNHSNKWLGKANDSDMEKMWSIIYLLKKDFSELNNWKHICNTFDLSITEVKKGKNQGCYGIRIRGMKKKPNETIIRMLLDYIFEDSHA